METVTEKEKRNTKITKRKKNENNTHILPIMASGGCQFCLSKRSICDYKSKLVIISRFENKSVLLTEVHPY